MKISKLLVSTVLPLVCTAILHSQSLTELAKKEKERRAKLKGKKSIVITNEDLRKMDIKPGLTSRRPVENQNTDTIRGDQAKPSPRKAKAAPSPEAKADDPNQDEAEPAAAVIELEEEWQQAHDTVGFLSLKLNGLWQRYYSGTAASVEQLQAQIGLTYLELQEAQKKAENLRLELEAAKKRKTP